MPSNCCDHPCTLTPRQRRLGQFADLGYLLMLLALGFVFGVIALGGHVCADEVSMVGGLVRGDLVASVRWVVGGAINTLKGVSNV